MARAAPSGRRTPAKAATTTGRGLSGLLRGSVNSMVGATGIDLPTRVLEQITTAVDRVSLRTERVVKQLDRLNKTVDILMDLRQETVGIAKKMDGIEKQLEEVRGLIALRSARAPVSAAHQQDGRTPIPRRRPSRRVPA